MMHTLTNLRNVLFLAILLMALSILKTVSLNILKVLQFACHWSGLHM